eukprot:NODE_63_length_26141_cov_1.022656.p15 type:complete len:253 gc:universal NODE_63_length_26141_cov_1.022656:26084-25326(-)
MSIPQSNNNSCFAVAESTFCSAWSGSYLKLGSKLENSDNIINDSNSLDQSILEVFNTHYNSIDSNCDKDILMPTYATWVCDSLFEKNACGSSKRMCKNTCSQFLNEYKNVTNTCSGDFKSQQMKISGSINKYCNTLKSSNCVGLNDNLDGNCGFHTKLDICTSCDSKQGEFCVGAGLMTNSFKVVTNAIIGTFSVLLIIVLTCVALSWCRKKKIRRLEENERLNERNGRHYFYDYDEKRLYGPTKTKTDSFM